MAKIKVNTDSMKQTELDFSEDIRKFKKYIDQIDQVVEEFHLIWEGDNHDTYVKNYNKNKKTLLDVYMSLKKFDEAFESAMKKYKKCGSEIYEYVRRLGGEKN